MKKTILIFSLLLVFLVSGCGGGQDNSVIDQQATEDFAHVVETSIVETIAAAIPEDPTPSVSEQTEVPTVVDASPTSTATPQPSLVPTQPSSAFTPTPTPLSTPCYLAVLVEETIPDGTIIKIGDGFTKVWVVRNAGVCAWSEDFRWQLVSGHDFRGITDVKISNKDVQPGETITISIEMGAPLIPDHYRSIYKIFTPEGAEITPNGFWIDVTVIEN